MNGLDGIIEKIVSDARETAAAIRQQAEEEAKTIRDGGEEEANTLARLLDAGADADAESILSRADSSASLAARRIKLEARQKLVSNLVDRALTYLPALPDEDKVDLYAGFLDMVRGGETVIFCTRDLDSGVAKKAVEKARSERKDKSLPDVELTIADQPGSFSGGLILKRGRIEENMTFELIAQQSREDLETFATGLLES